MEDNIPTVYPAEWFDPRKDADVLHKAIRGFGTGGKSLISVLCYRSRDQRVQIGEAFKSQYGKDLSAKLKSKLSVHFERVMVALSLPVAEFLAHEMHEAIHGIVTNERTLIEVLCTSTNEEIRQLNEAYLSLYGNYLEEDVKAETSGVFRTLLVALIQGQKNEYELIDFQKAKDDAMRLYEAGEARFIGTDESTFTSILASHSWGYLRQIMEEYELLKGHSLETAVANEFSFDAAKGFLAILQCAQNRPAYFARKLNNAMKGIRTDDLIRIVVSRCDIDLGSIEIEYKKQFGTTIQNEVAGDTSGYYKQALLALLG